MPFVPCNPVLDFCVLTGAEAMRYFSLEFTATTVSGYTPPSTLSYGAESVLWALNDSQFVVSPNGQVTLIVGITNQPPAGVTTANGYTYFNLAPFLTSAAPGFNSLLIRDLLPSPTFPCSTSNVPNYTMEYNNVRGFMGAYVPTVDFPLTSTIFGGERAPGRPNSCAAIPGPPTPSYNFPRTPV